MFEHCKFNSCKVFAAYHKLAKIANSGDMASAKYQAACKAYKERLVIGGGLPEGLAQEYADTLVHPGLILSDFSLF